MNAKKANRTFLITIILYIFGILGLSLLLPQVMTSLLANNLICELILVLPVIAAAIISKEKMIRFLGFHKIKPGTILMIFLFAFLSTPLYTVVNLISQFWVENEAVTMAQTFQMSEMPFGQIFLSIAVIAPFAEEVACRGAYYQAYKKSGNMLRAAFISAILFALFHMNLNQAAYAFVIGVAAVLLVEAAGSLWASILFHGAINGGQVFLMKATLLTGGDALAQQAEQVTPELLMYSLGIYLILAAVMTPLAWAVLVWIENHEGRRGSLSRIWKERKQKKDKLITVSLILALILCVAWIVFNSLLPVLLANY